MVGEPPKTFRRGMDPEGQLLCAPKQSPKFRRNSWTPVKIPKNPEKYLKLLAKFLKLLPQSVELAPQLRHLSLQLFNPARLLRHCDAA